MGNDQWKATRQDMENDIHSEELVYRKWTAFANPRMSTLTWDIELFDNVTGHNFLREGGLWRINDGWDEARLPRNWFFT